MERTAPDEAVTSPLLDGVPRQRPRTEPSGVPPEAAAEGPGGPGGGTDGAAVPEPSAVPGASAAADPGASPSAVPDASVATRPGCSVAPGGCAAVEASAAPGASAVVEVPAVPRASAVVEPSVVPGLLAVVRSGRPRLSRLLPTPAATPFTFVYAMVLVLTSVFARYAGPAAMNAVYQGSSTDVAHLVRTPLLVLGGSALWIAGGITSPYSLAFLLVLTGLERRIGALRAAGVFLYGHVLATLATEVPVGLAVLAGELPDSSLHRLDYGVSFGVAASLGALSGLLRPWLRWTVLAVFAGAALSDLLTFADPMTSAGHLVSVTLGVASWPAVRRWHRRRTTG